MRLWSQYLNRGRSITNIAVILAGGNGQRMGMKIPKQFAYVGGKPVIVYTMEAFQRHPDIDAIYVACLSGWEETLWAYALQFGVTKLKGIIKGGECGQESIRNCIFELERFYNPQDSVLIHDGIRPMVSKEVISDCLIRTRQYGCAIASLPCYEAMMETDDGLISYSAYPREKLKRTQTPQGFLLGDICDLHRLAQKRGVSNSVSSSTLMTEMGRAVYFSAGSEKNIKLTTSEDLEIFEAYLKAGIGHGTTE